MIEVKKGNLKLSKKVGIWTLPAGQEVCGRECKGCYALKSQRQYKNAYAYRMRNYEASKLDTFVSDIDLKKCSIIRVHESGEFYSQEYIDKWVEIAKNYPTTIFYAYTKRLNDFDFLKLEALPNFVLHNSLYGGVINYGKDISTQAEKFGGFVCPLTQKHNGKDWHGKCGDECTWCMEKCNQGTPIFFEQH